MGFTTHKHRHELEWMGENEKLVANIARADHVVAYTNIELCLNTESRFGKQGANSPQPSSTNRSAGVAELTRSSDPLMAATLDESKEGQRQTSKHDNGTRTMRETALHRSLCASTGAGHSPSMRSRKTPKMPVSGARLPTSLSSLAADIDTEAPHACQPLAAMGPRYIGPVEMAMTISAPPRVQYGSRFGSTLTGGGCFQYPGGQRFLCPPQGPMWNGQQWVTNGPTKAEHKAAMKDKADTRPQELVPADPDISRMYEVQELDGNWTRRSRYTIDSKDIGQVRWYQRPDGTFFAKRLPSG
ncbi:hypothetical protein V497_07898 [Pseudogymnoascus sp. VKM F-4516 (FW-969)]|nr:hypothetical protein V497_07898 [Pseudogymnoascus sp. VKM F-4516 (FW-969)]